MTHDAWRMANGEWLEEPVSSPFAVRNSLLASLGELRMAEALRSPLTLFLMVRKDQPGKDDVRWTIAKNSA